MADGIRWVGVDVHARKSMVAVFDQATGEVLTWCVVGWPRELLPVLREVPRAARLVYEAGRTSGGRRIASRPISVTRSAWRGCWRRGS
jgi:hypothetical protein